MTAPLSSAAVASQASLEGQLAALQAELATRRRHQRWLEQQVIHLEEQSADLARLYAACDRLHSSLDRADVVTTIQEIIANLIGSEEIAIFELTPGADTLTLIASTGIDAEQYRSIALGLGPIGEAARTGQRSVAEQSDVTACIPLRLGTSVRGVIAIFRMLPQKPALEPVDLQMFDLLSTHAAMALHCSTPAGAA